MIYQCSKCRGTFEKDGLQIIMHNQVAAWLCPECVSGADTVTISITREGAGKPYEFGHVEFIYPVNTNGNQEKKD